MINESAIEQSVVSCNVKRLEKLTYNVKNINFRIRRTHGLTLLHIAAGICEPESRAIVAHLLQSNADPNLRSDDGLTPTHIAATWNNFYVLPDLLKFGGNPFLKDDNNEDAFEMALENNADECYELLSCTEVDKRNTRFFNSTMFHTASEHSPQASRIKETSWCKNSPSVLFLGKSSAPNACLSPKAFDFREMKRWVESVNTYRMSDYGTNSTDEICTSSPNNNARSLKFNDKIAETITLDDTAFSSDTLCSTVTVSDTDDETIYSDIREGIVLVERRSRSLGNGIFTSDVANSQDSFPSDWKSFRTAHASLSSLDAPESVYQKVDIPDELMELSNMEIYAQLQIFGDNPGPVFDSTRELYLRRLAKLKSGLSIVYPLPKLKYPPEVYAFMKEELNMRRIRELEQEMADEFDTGAMASAYREGNQRCCFNYFLLDPRVTRNLPLRAFNMTQKEKYNIFLDALFYVGKGTKDRPFNHLYEAVKASNGTNGGKVSEKVAHILDIWQSGVGVISLHCFHSSIPVEAFTREASIIEAVGLPNLTNIRRGHFYGKSSRWTMTKKRQFGVLLLSRALEIFLLDGERVIRPKDVK